MNNCKFYYDKSANKTYAYSYPNDDKTKYLYESYPESISPLEGVTNQHFIVWMRTAGLPNFRKLYGRIHADFKKGDFLSFDVIANFEVSSFAGSKALIIAQSGEFGPGNPGLGIAYIVTGSISFFFAFIFAIKHFLFPRAVASAASLKWE